MKRRPTDPDQIPAPDPLQARLDTLTDRELLALVLRPGPLGWKACIAITERNLAKNPRHQFRLK
jgi:hypothetical protein